VKPSISALCQKDCTEIWLPSTSLYSEIAPLPIENYAKYEKKLFLQTILFTRTIVAVNFGAAVGQ